MSASGCCRPEQRCRASGCRSSRCRRRSSSTRRTPRGQCRPAARARWRPGGARRPAHCRRAGLGVAPGVAAEEVDLPLRDTPSSTRSWPGSLPWNCWLRSQLSCSRAAACAPGRPSAATGRRCLVAQRPDHQLHAARRPARQAQRGAVEAQRRARWRLSCTAARSAPIAPPPCSGAACASSRRWLTSRARTMPSTPCQAIAAITAITSSATSTSTRVKPAGASVRHQ